VAVIQTAGSSVTAQNHLQEKIYAEWVALNQLTRMQVAAEVPEVGKYEGTEKMAGRQWRWFAQVQATSNPFLLKADVQSGLVDQQQYLMSVTGYLNLPNE